MLHGGMVQNGGDGHPEIEVVVGGVVMAGVGGVHVSARLGV